MVRSCRTGKSCYGRIMQDRYVLLWSDYAGQLTLVMVRSCRTGMSCYGRIMLDRYVLLWSDYAGQVCLAMVGLCRTADSCYGLITQLSFYGAQGCKQKISPWETESQIDSVREISVPLLTAVLSSRSKITRLGWDAGSVVVFSQVVKYFRNVLAGGSCQTRNPGCPSELVEKWIIEI